MLSNVAKYSQVNICKYASLPNPWEALVVSWKRPECRGNSQQVQRSLHNGRHLLGSPTHVILRIFSKNLLCDELTSFGVTYTCKIKESFRKIYFVRNLKNLHCGELTCGIVSKFWNGGGRLWPWWTWESIFKIAKNPKQKKSFG